MLFTYQYIVKYLIATCFHAMHNVSLIINRHVSIIYQSVTLIKKGHHDISVKVNI